MAGANRVGVDGFGNAHRGISRIIDPQGRIIAGQSHTEEPIVGVFSVSALKAYRDEFPAWMDADTDVASI